jgi:broad specificity phosphatase PhoE
MRAPSTPNPAPPPARLLLVRHGQIEANVLRRWHGSTDEDLTDFGREQAKRIAAHVASEHPRVAAVYTSPAQRARNTATPIAAALGLPLVVAPGLAEYAIGVLENEPYDDLVAKHRFFERADADLSWAPSGGESLGAVGARVVATWREIARTHPGAEILAVSHGAAIAAGLASLLHDDPRGWTRYHVRNTSLTEIEVEPVGRVVRFDRLDHLP